jgi:hypothetical protein
LSRRPCPSCVTRPALRYFATTSTEHLRLSTNRTTLMTVRMYALG